MTGAVRIIARIAEIAMGLFFVFAALLKVQNPQLFVIQIHEYQVITNKDLLGPLALFFLTLEMTLGLCMLAGLRLRGLVPALVAGLLVFFTGLIAYAWAFHGLKDCGCLGEVPMGPGASILKNIGLMMAGAFAWWVLLRAPAAEIRPWDKLILCLGTGIMTLSVAYLDLYQKPADEPEPKPADATATVAESPAEPPAGEAADRPYAQFQIDNGLGETYDLGKGLYLVASLSATCDHCMASVPTLNEYVMREDVLPPLVGICYEPEAGSLAEFQGVTSAAFPLHSLGDDFIAFVKFMDQEPPRLAIVRDGAALRTWDVDMPPVDEVIAAVEELSTPASDAGIAATPATSDL